MTQLRHLGRTGLQLSCIGMGGVPLGEIYHRIEEDEADDTLDAAWQAGYRYFDTSPWYGRGLSELRFGRLLRRQCRDHFVISTKVGRTFHRPSDPDHFVGDFWKGGLPFAHRFDYTYDGIMRSYDQSMMRLGLNRIDLLLIHDLDVAEIGSQDLVNAHLRDLEMSGWRALESLRHFGEIRGVGAGVNILGVIPEFLRRFDVDFFLVAMPYTLLDQTPLEDEFPLCAERGVGIIIGSPFASGILATGADVVEPFYNYMPASPEIIEKTRRIETVCSAHGVPLKAAAYQFPLLLPLVCSVVGGPGSGTQARENAGLVQWSIPPQLWLDLRAEGLIHPGSIPSYIG